MRSLRSLPRLALVVAASCTLAGGTAFADDLEPLVRPTAPRIAIIVNRRNPVPAMPEKELEGVFLLERRVWLGTSRITVVQRPRDTEIYRIFHQRILSQYFNELPDLYAERKKSVKTVSSDADAVAAVVEDASAIAYVWEQSVTSAVRQVATVDLEDPNAGMAPARTARLMGTLRGLWDQLQSSLRNPRMPPDELVVIARAVAEESANTLSLVPRGKDESTLMFQKLAFQLRDQSRTLPGLVENRAEALARMADIEKKLCMECHRVFRQ
jgi:hypothetical protein